MTIPDLFAALPVLPTTVVGSFPVDTGRGLPGLLFPLRHAVQKAVESQVRAGIDIISDGQVRGDMIRAFSSRLPGIRGQDVVSTVLPASGSITVADTRYALSRHRFVKGILTGPTTLSFGLHIATPVYRDRADLAMDLARALAAEAKALESAGVCMLQVDEPVLSTGAADVAGAERALKVLLEGIHVPVCLHVCGDLSSVIDRLLAFPVDVLDIECAKTPQNLELVSERDLRKRGSPWDAWTRALPASRTRTRLRGGSGMPSTVLVQDVSSSTLTAASGCSRSIPRPASSPAWFPLSGK